MTDEQWELLYPALVERLRTEDERMTVALANGVAISLSKEAQQAWASVHAPKRTRAPRNSAAFWATLMQLRALFPGAVTIEGRLPKEPD